jgi:hypothetical protein
MTACLNRKGRKERKEQQGDFLKEDMLSFALFASFAVK